MIITKDTSTNNILFENQSGVIVLSMSDKASFKVLGDNAIYIVDRNGLQYTANYGAISAIYLGSNQQSFSSLQEVLALFNTVIFNNSNSNASSSMDAIVGEIKTWAGVALPSNEYMNCDGSILSTTQYPVLFNAIGYTFGGSDTNFNLPDLRGRTIVGTGDATASIGGTLANGDSGGAKENTLTTSNLPEHNHGLSGVTITGTVTVGTNENAPSVESGDGAVLGKTNADDVLYNATNPAGELAGVSHNLSLSGDTDNEGESSPTALSTVQPYTALNYIIKVQ